MKQTGKTIQCACWSCANKTKDYWCHIQKAHVGIDSCCETGWRLHPNLQTAPLYKSIEVKDENRNPE
jgi:hypothetical protein